MEAEKFDIVKLHPELYKAQKDKPQLIKVPALRILAINGEGDPNGPRFQDSVAALYSIVYAIKFMPRKGIAPEGYQDFKVSLLESLWSMKNGKAFDADKIDQWLWEAFIVVPGFITQALVQQAIAMVEERKPNERYSELHISTLQEKKAAQILHVGPYDKEAKNIEKLHKYISKIGYKPSARHHEIYLNDPSRVSPDKIKTILRQPVVRL